MMIQVVMVRPKAEPSAHASPLQRHQQPPLQDGNELGAIALREHLPISQLRCKIREMLVCKGLAQAQTTFCLYRETPREVSRAGHHGQRHVMRQLVRVVLWPSQDDKQLSHVFRPTAIEWPRLNDSACYHGDDAAHGVLRPPPHKVLVLLGPVVPRRSCSAAKLSQLTLLTLSPLVRARAEAAARRGGGDEIAQSDGMKPPSGCLAPLAKRPRCSSMQVLKPAACLCVGRILPSKAQNSHRAYYRTRQHLRRWSLAIAPHVSFPV